jgi:hypothetical protein
MQELEKLPDKLQLWVDDVKNSCKSKEQLVNRIEESTSTFLQPLRNAFKLKIGDKLSEYLWKYFEINKDSSSSHNWKIGDAFQVIQDNPNSSVLKKGIIYYVHNVKNNSVDSSLTKGGNILSAGCVMFQYMIPAEVHQDDPIENTYYIHLNSTEEFDLLKEHFTKQGYVNLYPKGNPIDSRYFVVYPATKQFQLLKSGMEYNSKSINSIIKPIEKWSVGSYVVFFNNSTLHGVKLGTIDKIKYKIDKEGDSFFVDYGCCSKNRLDLDVKWFATLEEAEIFSKSLQPPKKDHNPEYVKLVNMDFWKEGYRDLKLGTIYKWSHLTSGIIASLNSDYWDRWTKEFEISTKAEYDAQQNQLIPVEIDKTQRIKPFAAMSKEELLEYAKKKYPIGTKYKSASGDYEVHTVESMDWAFSPAYAVYGEDNKGCIYLNGKWAEIVEPPKTEEYNRGNIGSNISSITYSYTGPTASPKEAHQSINKTGKKFSPIKVELIKVKQLKIN